MGNAVACVVVSIWEKACDCEVLQRELTQGFAATAESLEGDATAVTPIAVAAEASVARLR